MPSSHHRSPRSQHTTLNPNATEFVMPTPSQPQYQSPTPFSAYRAPMTWSEHGAVEIDKLTQIEEDIARADQDIQAIRDRGDSLSRGEKRHLMVMKSVRKELQNARRRLLAKIVNSRKGGGSKRRTVKKNKNKTGGRSAMKKTAHKKSRRN